MITWLWNVISGRLKHWNEANNAYVSDLLERAKAFPPAIEALFVQFTAASYIVVDSLVGPSRGGRRIIKKDCRTISRTQYAALHHLNLWAFVASFGVLNPQFRESIFAACRDFVGITDPETKVVQKILRYEKLDVGKICSDLWPEITDILGYRSDGVLEWFLLVPPFSAGFVKAMEKWKEAFKELR